VDHSDQDSRGSSRLKNGGTSIGTSSVSTVRIIDAAEFKETLDDFQKNVMPQVAPNHQEVYGTVL
jgi:RNA processing factor Prp31